MKSLKKNKNRNRSRNRSKNKSKKRLYKNSFKRGIAKGNTDPEIPEFNTEKEKHTIYLIWIVFWIKKNNFKT